MSTFSSSGSGSELSSVSSGPSSSLIELSSPSSSTSAPRRPPSLLFRALSYVPEDEEKVANESSTLRAASVSKMLLLSFPDQPSIQHTSLQVTSYSRFEEVFDLLAAVGVDIRDKDNLALRAAHRKDIFPRRAMLIAHDIPQSGSVCVCVYAPLPCLVFLSPPVCACDREPLVFLLSLSLCVCVCVYERERERGSRGICLYCGKLR